MIPTAANSDYPKFVADQVLTSDNLNDLFGYLDEQGRMTRTNLSGIGIVCGLEVNTAADGSSITITKGVGVTSSGYLVSVPEVTYTKRTTAVFDAVKCEYYSKFVNIATKTQKFDLWELKQEAESEGTTALNNSFLTTGEKIVLIFVELLEENNKNCDPNSCDDKGINVTVTFRPLLVEKANVAGLLNGAGATANPWLSLPQISMKRFDVTATPMYECVNIFNAYKAILSGAFLTKTQTALTGAYNILQPLLADEFPANPFATLADDFEFLHDGSISSDQLVNMQYYYDLFSDILLAYKEFSDKGTDVIGMCCPDDIFPRHLLLDLAIPEAGAQTSAYRHYFIPSPILSDEHKTISCLKILFNKLVLLTQKFLVPPPTINGANKNVDGNIRITPSLLWDVPLSAKSIPYYYNIANANDPFLKNWSPEKSTQGKTKRNLSYHAKKYNFTDDDIRHPLLYDLEPYNFLRIEGHIGKPYAHVVKNLLALRDKNRLPFEVVALNADISAVIDFIKKLATAMLSGNSSVKASLESLMGSSCHFNDLELLYDSIMAEMTGKLSNEMKFFYDVERDDKRGPLNMPPPASNIPQVSLIKNTDGTFRIKNKTIGLEFELFYPNVKNAPFIPINFFVQGILSNQFPMDYGFVSLLYYTQKLYETVTTGLSSFSFIDFYIRYESLMFVAKVIKFIGPKANMTEEQNDHLDAILSISADRRMMQLYFEFLLRLVRVKVMQQAGFYFNAHPGVQHKAGVPMGGTFIVVYHEADKTEVAGTAAAVESEPMAFTVTETADLSETMSFAKADLDESKFTAENIGKMSENINLRVKRAGEGIVSGLYKSFKISQAGDTQKAGVAKPIANKAADPGAETNAAAANAAETSFTVEAKNNNEAVFNYLAGAAAYLKNRQGDVLDEAIEDFNDGIVIADFYLPYLCCSDCQPIQMVIGAEPEKPNENPVADAGPDAETDMVINPSNGSAQATVKLNGTNSKDPEGDALTFLWKEKSGNTAVSIQGDTLAEPTVIFRTAGVFTFELTVADKAGKTDTDEVVITVNQPEPANLEITGKEGPYCNEKNGQLVRLLATPVGGNFSSVPTGVNVQTDAGGFFFMPESLTAGTYQLKYAFTDGRNDSISFGISQAFTVKFAKPVPAQVPGSGFIDITFRVNNIPGATYQWDFTIDSGTPQSRQTTVNSVVIRVNRQQQVLNLRVSVAASPCSAQAERDFNIQSIIG
ncbi:MAG: PKD domain-containing protein [Ferruginibacter sp.]|nr:PKD domain-containing protein [Ferruginibacter sp.]